MINEINKIKAEIEEFENSIEFYHREFQLNMAQAKIKRKNQTIKTSLTLVNGMIELLVSIEIFHNRENCRHNEMNEDLKQLNNFKEWLEERQ